ncbi:tryptophan 7-halogenase [Kribbella antibiotica]|uniref:Tryptophan 7-halogenase n=1 Tax=Kribbella antibiotica TaxID=190195 RepID=A0A4V2YPS0_9ACTN|nr:tryptophan halogenase family protein [Kribbella antibiotica]TDD59257.1 tryptophan 7-halogenase [Kribbella antibiotica]
METTDNRIKNVVILGGGTAGWMTAAYLGKALQGTTTITVLEAPAVPRIGVGEATIPNLQSAFFDFLGIPEEEWMRECNASFKESIKFVNWSTPGAGESTPRLRADGKPDYFYHAFGQLPNHDGIPLSHYWYNDHVNGRTDRDFAFACYPVTPAMDAHKSPRRLDGTRVASYAWHFDANLVAAFLCKFAVEKQGVVHISDQMTEAVQDERGFVTALKTKDGRTVEGDLFVDCSGFRGLLINKAMAEPFIDMSDHLLNDSAVATQIPHDDAANGVEPFTSAIAMSAGWTWKIPMLGRFGTGYVYSSKFASEDDATAEFSKMWGLDPKNTDFNKIRFRVGRNERAWVKNVVSVGLASCFVEPLESTGIYFITGALFQLAKNFPNLDFDPVLIKQFNAEIETMFDDTRDFIQAHFYYSPRTDTPFWQANKELYLAEGFQEKVAMYKSGMVVNMPIMEEGGYYKNFEAEFRNFWTNNNYYCVLAGLGVLPDRPMPALAYRPESVAGAEPLFAELRRKQEALVESLPSTYEYLTHFHGK